MKIQNSIYVERCYITEIGNLWEMFELKNFLGNSLHFSFAARKCFPIKEIKI